jgi:AraC family transcriptional regulator, ethanolamine operon transcriptional activator
MPLFAKLRHQDSAKAKDVPREPFWVSVVRATDMDEFIESVREYHLGFMQLDHGPFVAESIQARVGPMLLSAANYERTVVQSGEPPSKMISFAMRTSATPALWQGRRFGLHHLLVATPGIEIDIVSQPGYGAVTASIPQELVRKTADRIGRRLATGTAKSLLVDLTPEKADLLRSTLGGLFNEAVARPFDERAASAAASKREALLRILLQSMPDAPSSTQAESDGERSRVLKAALAAINEQSDDVLTIGDLCRFAGASERTLERAFTERFGLPPAHYVKANRLNGARSDLYRDHDPPMKIADVANKWGFWHLGQFAHDYRIWFGELPSDTYARKHGSDARKLGSDVHGV